MRNRLREFLIAALQQVAQKWRVSCTRFRRKPFFRQKTEWTFTGAVSTAVFTADSAWQGDFSGIQGKMWSGGHWMADESDIWVSEHLWRKGLRAADDVGRFYVIIIFCDGRESFDIIFYKNRTGGHIRKNYTSRHTRLILYFFILTFPYQHLLYQ